MNDHERLQFMNRALELAARGEGLVSPNPMVGCVIVREDQIIGEGWHEGCGLPHAEVNALRAAGDARGARVFVTMEPCAHQGRTGPCADALIDAGITAVDFAMHDPSDLAGGGSEKLKAAGLSVTAGLCEAEAKRLNRIWLYAEQKRSPFVIGKTASSLDGRIATSQGDSKWITSAASRQRSHRLRNRVDAVVVGANTIMKDNPSLTARDETDKAYPDAFQPFRVVLDSSGRTEPEARVYSQDDERAIIATTDRMPDNKRKAFERAGVKIIMAASTNSGRVDLNDLLQSLFEIECRSILVEGGGKALGSFIGSGLVNELWAFVAAGTIIGNTGTPSIAGFSPATLNDAIRLDNVTIEQLDRDVLVRGDLKRA